MWADGFSSFFSVGNEKIIRKSLEGSFEGFHYLYYLYSLLGSFTAKKMLFLRNKKIKENIKLILLKKDENNFKKIIV